MKKTMSTAANLTGWAAAATLLLTSGLKAGIPTTWISSQYFYGSTLPIDINSGLEVKFHEDRLGTIYHCHDRLPDSNGYDHLHSWRNPLCIKFQLNQLKDAGIKLVLGDLTNLQYVDPDGAGDNEPTPGPLAELHWQSVNRTMKELDENFPSIEFAAVLDARKDKDARGNPLPGNKSIKDLNEQAKQIWNRYARPEAPYRRSYHHYTSANGSKGKPLLCLFFWNGDLDEWKRSYANAALENKEFLNEFRIMYSSDTANPESPWGWHTTITKSPPNANGDYAVCFVSTVSKIYNTEGATKITAEAWANRVNQCAAATEYSIYGGFDDAREGNGWGIADTREAYEIDENGARSDSLISRYPPVKVGDRYEYRPRLYFDVLKKKLNPNP